MMKALYPIVMAGFITAPWNLVLAEHLPEGTFKQKGEDLRPHTEVHYHVHSDVREAGEASPQAFRSKSGDFVREVHIHLHAHPEVRDAPADPEAFVDKRN